MKILHICCNLAGSTVFPQMFESLNKAALKQIVFVPERRAKDMHKNKPKGVPTIYRMTVKATDMLFFFRKAQRTVPVIRRDVDLSGVTLIHAHTLFTDGSIARSLAQKTGLPYMVTLRYSDIAAIWKYEPHLRPMARRILKDAKKVVCLSGAAKDAVLGWFKGTARDELARKMEIIPNGIDPAWLDGKPKTAPHEPVRVGFAGLLNPRKRPLDAIAAVHRANEKQSGRFIARVCGDGPLKEAVCAAMKPEDSYLGRISGMDAMKRFYADCDVLLVPSSAETFGMVYLEAMSQGVPVLYTKGQGFDGQFPEGEVGFSVPCGDTAAQADALCRVMEDYPARSARCVERAREYAWERIARKWMKAYGETAAALDPSPKGN